MAAHPWSPTRKYPIETARDAKVTRCPPVDKHTPYSNNYLRIETCLAKTSRMIAKPPQVPTGFGVKVSSAHHRGPCPLDCTSSTTHVLKIHPDTTAHFASTLSSFTLGSPFAPPGFSHVCFAPRPAPFGGSTDVALQSDARKSSMCHVMMTLPSCFTPTVYRTDVLYKYRVSDNRREDLPESTEITQPPSLTSTPFLYSALASTLPSGSLNLPVDRPAPCLHNECIRLREVLASEEASVRGEPRGVRAL